jgi:hypothetical protein
VIQTFLQIETLTNGRFFFVKMTDFWALWNFAFYHESRYTFEAKYLTLCKGGLISEVIPRKLSEISSLNFQPKLKELWTMISLNWFEVRAK